MATDTDIKLRSALDANQRDREQMCRAILALDRRYSEVRPRHPHGGPDGGRDIEAVLDGDRTAYGAVGFANGANDSPEQKAQIRTKFRDDLSSALKAKGDLSGFVFFTNLHFTMGEQASMKTEAKAAGIAHCDVLDRERLRIELDSPAGFFIRFQHLGIPLSPGEQASFLSRYGDQLQDMVSSGFSRVEKTLNRMLFLQEASSTLGHVTLQITLKRPFPGDEVGHFRAYWMLVLRAITHGIHEILAASSDKSSRFSHANAPLDRVKSGIRHGIAGGQWEQCIEAAEDKSTATGVELEAAERERWKQVGSSSRIGLDPVEHIHVDYNHDDELFRFRPRLQLRDLDDCWFAPVMNRSLAELVLAFNLYANGYHLLAVGPGEFLVDEGYSGLGLPGDYSETELADPWVMIRPVGASVFTVRFSSHTPRRTFGHDEVTLKDPESVAASDAAL